MHIPDGYLSPSTCAVLYGAACRMVFRAEAVEAHAVDSGDPADLRLRRVLVCGDDVQPAAAGRHHRPRPGCDHRNHRAWPLGRDTFASRLRLPSRRYSSATAASATLGANCFNMAIVGSLVAYGSYRMIAAGSQHRVQAARGRGGHRRLSRGECRGAGCRRRVWHPAHAVSRCPAERRYTRLIR